MISDHFQTNVDTYLQSEDKTIVCECTKQLKCGAVKLVDFVASLEKPLTSKETHCRRRGMQLLAEVVQLLPTDFFSDAEVTLLMDFFCARLGDHHSIAPLCLSGIASLIGHKSLHCEDLTRILQSIFSEVTVQTLVQTDRMLVYDMFQRLLNERLQDLQIFGDEFVNGFMQAIDSEKDPRNLLVTLKLVKVVASNFPLDHVGEQLFEVISCYYPIDFSPPTSSSVSVTKEQLAIALRDALLSTPAFAPFCLPLLIEKLASSVTEAKIDALQTLIHSCKAYHQSDIMKHMSDFWSLIRTDVFTQRTEIEDLALQALTSLVKYLSETAEKVDDNGEEVIALSSFIKVAYDDCGKYLCQPDQVICKQSGKLLTAICRSSEPACLIIMKCSVPQLIAEYHLRSEKTHHIVLLEILQSLIEAATTISANKSPLIEYKELLSSMFISSLTSSVESLRHCAVRGVGCLLRANSLLSDEDFRTFTRLLLNMLLSDLDFTVRQECSASLTLLACKQPTVICRDVLPVLIGTLQGLPTEDYPVGPHVDASFLLSTIASFSVDTIIIVETVPAVFQWVAHLSDDDSEKMNKMLHSGCICLTNIVSTMSGECSEYFVSWLAQRCVAVLLERCMSSEQYPATWTLATGLSRTVRTIVQRSANDIVRDFVSSVICLFLRGDTEPFASFTTTGTLSFRALDPNSSAEETCLLELLTAVVCSSMYSLVEPFSDELMKFLMEIAFQGTVDRASVSATKCLAGLINRRQSDSFLDSLLQDLKSKVASQSTTIRSRIFNIVIWITKSLVLRNHPLQLDFIHIMVESLSEHDLAPWAADGFKVIISSDPDLTDNIFSSASHAVITLMYQQRFFTLALPLLLNAHKTACSELQPFYVMSLMHLMEFVPKQVLLPEIQCLLPVLVQSLMSNDPTSLIATLDMLNELASGSPDTLHSYISDLLPRLLTISEFPTSMKVRIAALGCISQFAAMPGHLILPHQQQVISRLGDRLDDHKRLVRQQAAAARSKWFFVGSGDS